MARWLAGLLSVSALKFMSIFNVQKKGAAEKAKI